MSSFKRFMSISNRGTSQDSNSNRNSISSLPDSSERNGRRESQQFSNIDGRDLSDINHINYDPAQDPELSK